MPVCELGHLLGPGGGHVNIKDVGEHPNGHYQHAQEEPVAAAPKTSKHTIEIETQLIGTVIRPGDRIIIAFRRRLNMQEKQEVIEEIEHRLPGVGGVVLDEVAGLAVYREDKDSIHYPGRHATCPNCGSEGPPSNGCQNLWHVEVRGRI